MRSSGSSPPENNKRIEGIRSRALDVLRDYDWPGNVRELKNCIEGMVVMCAREGVLEVGDIPRYINRQERVFSGLGFRVGMSMAEIEQMAIARDAEGGWRRPTARGRNPANRPQYALPQGKAIWRDLTALIVVVFDERVECLLGIGHYIDVNTELAQTG